MLPEPTLPPSLMTLLERLRPCFTTPTFTTFCALVVGTLAQTARRTVTGMLVGSGLSRVWSHDRAPTFFSGARWCADELGQTLARLVVAVLVPPEATVTVIVDDTLFHHCGPKVWAAGWFHDGSAKTPEKVGYGNNWVILGIIVRLPLLDRPVGLPVTARLVRKNTTSASRLGLARQAIDALAAALPGRRRLRRQRTRRPTRPGHLDHPATQQHRPGRPDPSTHRKTQPTPQERGPAPPPGPARRHHHLHPTEICRYGQTASVPTATISCLWYGVFGTQPVTVILVRERYTARGGYNIALVTTDTAATAAQTVERYAARWSVEVAVEDAKQLFGVGQAHTRKPLAVARTVPFGLACHTLTITWYATAGHHPDDVTDHRARAPWYRTKRHPSTADMLTKLRRVLVATKFRPTQPEQPTPAEIHAIRLAWDTPAA